MKNNALFVLILLFFCANLSAQKFYTSPIVHDDNTVTFNLFAPSANLVTLNIVNSGIEEIAADTLAMSEDGLWSITVGPFVPEIYYYTFTTDGSRHADIRNQNIKKWLYSVSVFEIPGDPPLLHEIQNVPHGTVHLELYRSEVTNSTRPAIVYTPPKYDEIPKEEYPVVYLMHGWGGKEVEWFESGRISTIMDNLIDQELIEPMIAVAFDTHTSGRTEVEFGGLNDETFQAFLDKNTLYTERDLKESLIPFIEAKYKVKKEANSRAILGVSMSGPMSLDIGFSNLDKFTWIGSMSGSFYRPEKYLKNKALQDAIKLNGQVNLLWMSYGQKELKDIPKEVYNFSNWLSDQGIKYTWHEGNGGHEWDTWRIHITEFLKLVFKDSE